MTEKYSFTQNWFEPNKKIWDAMLVNYKYRPIRYLEIGSHEGGSTTWVLDNLDAEVYCVDPFLTDDETSPVDEKTYERFINNINQSLKSVFLFREKSFKVLPEIYSYGKKFDVVYIDGSHKPMDIMFDAIVCSNLVAEGGMLIFDDYLGGGIDYPIRKVIDYFISMLNPQEWRISGNWYQIFLQKSFNPNRKDMWDLEF